MGLPKSQLRIYARLRRCSVVVTFSAILFLYLRKHFSSDHRSDHRWNHSSRMQIIVSSLHSSDNNGRPEILQDSEQVMDDEKQTVQHSDASEPSKEPCLPYIFYDKPVKTGSTAVTNALSKYLVSKFQPAAMCLDKNDCTRVGVDMCLGSLPRGHLIEHMWFNSSMAACLRNKGYYHVTSIREPEERVISAWRYSKSQKISFYGIPYNATFAEFVTRFPRCSLYYYYDMLPEIQCTKEQAVQRAEEIANRFDEVINLYDSVVSDVHRRIHPFLENVNVAPEGRARANEFQIPEGALEMEYLLYNKLKEKRISLAVRPKRVLCEI